LASFSPFILALLSLLDTVLIRIRIQKFDPDSGADLMRFHILFRIQNIDDYKDTKKLQTDITRLDNWIDDQNNSVPVPVNSIRKKPVVYPLNIVTKKYILS
jgi:hypothetical protein